MGRAMKNSGTSWASAIPSTWNTIAFWQAIERLGTGLNPRDNFELSKDDELYYVTIRNIKDGKLFLDENCDRISKEAWNIIQERSQLQKGDILFASISKDGQAYIVEENPTNWNINESVFCIRPNSKIFDSKFLYYQLINDAYYTDLRMDATGSTFQSIKQKKLKLSRLLVPPMKEQKKIAHFLDSECFSIDEILDQTKKSIEEYKYLKQAFITQAVTKGIRGKRPMKDSGIEWVGDIPVDWQIRRIKTLFDLRNEKNYLPLNEVNLISLYTDQGVIQHSDLEKTVGNKASNADGYKKVYKDDIVVNIILCWMGAIGRSNYEGVTSPAYDVYVPKQDVDSSFYHYYFRTKGFSGDCYKRGRGIMAMRWRTYSDQFRDIPVAVPPISEQKEITEYLDAKCSAIDHLIDEKTLFISELENYKKSLIYEYVTGKKEVPSA